MAKKIEEMEETAVEETTEAAAEESPAKLEPGKARIRYLWDHYSQDWGAPELHKQGKEMVVDAAKAQQLATEYGGPTRGNIYREPKQDQVVKPMKGEKITDLGCPFEIIEGNKALGKAPKTK